MKSTDASTDDSTDASTDDVARRVFGAVPPRAPSTRHEQRLPVPVPVRGRGAPDGVPLEEILGVAKEASSTVEGLMVRGDELTVVHSTEPDAEQRSRLDRLFGDPDGLMALGRPGTREALAPGTLRAALLDEKTPDAEWLRMFRQWAVRELLAREGDR